MSSSATFLSRTGAMVSASRERRERGLQNELEKIMVDMVDGLVGGLEVSFRAFGVEFEGVK